MNDLVSVVVPVYKVEQYIVDTLESIVNQSYKNLELILVNDGTPDNSIAVATEYLSDKDIRWKVVEEPNSGLPTARNNGIMAATGKWVICPDSDDFIAPRTIEKMVEAAVKLSVRCVFCGFKTVDDKSIKDSPIKEGKAERIDINILRKRFLERRIVPLAPGMLLDKAIFDTLKYDKDCPHDEDIHFMWQLFYKIDDVAFIDADYYNYRLRNSSMSYNLKPVAYLSTSERYAVMTEDLIQQYPDDKVAKCIYPKYRLGGAHVLARSTDYESFKKTVIKDGYRRDMKRLIFQSDLKLSLYTLLYCISLKLFYKISKK